MSEPDQREDRPGQILAATVEAMADASFSAAAAAVVGVLVCAAGAVLSESGTLLLVLLVLAVPAPFVAAAVTLNIRVGALRERLERGQSIP